MPALACDVLEVGASTVNVLPLSPLCGERIGVRGMKALFLDCNDQLAPVWARVLQSGDPPIDVNRKTFARDELPAT